MSWLWTRPPVSDREPPSGASPNLPRGGAAGDSGRGEASVEMLDRGKEEFMGQDKGSGGNMRVDTDLIRQLADLLTEKDLSEIEVEDSDRRVVVKRNTMARDMVAVMGHGAAAPAVPAPSAPAPAPTPAAPVSEEAAASHPGAVKSPMVGTVRLSA